MRRRILAALLVGELFFAYSDILTWQRVFEAHGLWQFDAAYQTGHRTVLLGMVAVGVILLWDSGLWAAWWAVAFYWLSFTGLEDTLYYWLDGRAIPDRLPWLDANPWIWPHPVTSWSLIGSSAFWLALVVASCWLPSVVCRHRALMVLVFGGLFFGAAGVVLVWAAVPA